MEPKRTSRQHRPIRSFEPESFRRRQKFRNRFYRMSFLDSDIDQNLAAHSNSAQVTLFLALYAKLWTFIFFFFSFHRVERRIQSMLNYSSRFVPRSDPTPPTAWWGRIARIARAWDLWTRVIPRHRRPYGYILLNLRQIETYQLIKVKAELPTHTAR